MIKEFASSTMCTTTREKEQNEKRLRVLTINVPVVVPSHHGRNYRNDTIHESTAL